MSNVGWRLTDDVNPWTKRERNDAAVPIQHNITGIMNLTETAMLLGGISLRGNVKDYDHHHGHGNQCSPE